MCGLLVCCRFLELVRKLLDGNLIRTVEQLGETLYTDLCLNFRDVAVVGGGRPGQPLLCEVALKMVCAAAHKVYLRKAIAAAKVEAPAPVAPGAALGTFRDFGSVEDVQYVSNCVFENLLPWMPCVFACRLQLAMANLLGSAKKKAASVDLGDRMQATGLDQLFPVDSWPDIVVVRALVAFDVCTA